MIGQEKLLSKINSVEDIPKSLLIVSPSGMGKKTFVNTVVTKFNLNLFDITECFSEGLKTDLYITTIDTVVLVNLDILSIPKSISLQNSILKLIEEPPKYCKIIILSSYDNDVLQTVKNRCNIWKLDNYSVEELRSIAKINNINVSKIDDNQLKYLMTPYNIIHFSNYDIISDMEELAEKVIQFIHKANLSNTLTIGNKFDDKYDINLFMNILCNKLLSKTIGDCDDYHTLFNMYKLSNHYRNVLLHTSHINKKNFIDKFLLELRSIIA